MHQIHCTWPNFIYLHRTLGGEKQVHGVTFCREIILPETAITAGPLGLGLDVELNKAADRWLVALYEIALTEPHVAEG